jgi:hypothetical protein
MGLLEYQAMPSLHDVAHNDVLCTFRNRSALDRGKVVWSFRAGVMDRPSGTKSHPAGVILLWPARRAAVLGQLSSLWPHSLGVRLSSGLDTLGGTT